MWCWCSVPRTVFQPYPVDQSLGPPTDILYAPEPANGSLIVRHHATATKSMLLLLGRVGLPARGLRLAGLPQRRRFHCHQPTLKASLDAPGLSNASGTSKMIGPKHAPIVSLTVENCCHTITTTVSHASTFVRQETPNTRVLVRALPENDRRYHVLGRCGSTVPVDWRCRSLDSPCSEKMVSATIPRLLDVLPVLS